MLYMSYNITYAMTTKHHSDAPRDPRQGAPAVGMDLSRSVAAINRDLIVRFGYARTFWWELETDEKSGWVYTPSSHILVKLVHVPRTTE